MAPPPRSGRLAVLALALVGLALASAPAAAVIDWRVTYDDVVASTGVGFDDPARGAARRATFGSMLSYLSTQYVAPGTVELRVEASQTDGLGYLARADAEFDDADGPGYSNGSLFDAAYGNDGLDGPDGSVQFDFGYDWNDGLAAPGPAQFDLFTMALHEVVHTLGVISQLGTDGKSKATHTNPGVFSVYNRFMQRGDGTPMFDDGGAFVGSLDDITSNDVWFAGPNATAANGGQRVRVYAPDWYVAGSSLSHITGDADYVMAPVLWPGTMNRTLSDVELGVLADLGWQPHPLAGNIVGDVNFDGEVDGLDINPFLDVLKHGAGGDAALAYAADANGDGRVNLLDIGRFRGLMDDPAGAAPEPAPEPTGLPALAVGAMVLAGYRRRGPR